MCRTAAPKGRLTCALRKTDGVTGDTYSGGKVATGLEFLQGHGAGVSAEEEDERHEGDVRDIVTVVANKLTPILQALLGCQSCPVNGGVVLQEKGNVAMWLCILCPSWDRLSERNREASCRS